MPTRAARLTTLPGRLLTLALTLLAAFGSAAPGARAGDPPVFFIEVPALTEGAPFTGRIIVSLVNTASSDVSRSNPADGPFFDDPQPIYSMRVENLMPGDQIKFVDELSFPAPLKDLPAGRYMVQAVFDGAREHTVARQEAGNLNSPARLMVHDPDASPAVVQLPLLNIGQPPMLTVPNVEIVEVLSDLLSSFRGKDVFLRAGVVLPVGYEESRAYPAVYVVPGTPGNNVEFGGDHRDAYRFGFLRSRSEKLGEKINPLWSNAFYIVLDPMGPWGHHLFADSANNGPVGEALVTELIPAIEERFGLVDVPAGRIVTGHSSGGWSSIWLALHHPDVFGAAWASSPDPVDFTAFQRSNIYTDDSMFVDASGQEVPSYRKDGRARMTVRQENAMERVMDPDLGSQQQWASWFAVFGPRAANGAPAPLFDPLTGKIDRNVANAWAKYDIAALLRENPGVYGPILRDNVRILIGDQDNYYLERAVQNLKDQMTGLGLDGGDGSITIVSGADHSTVLTPESLDQTWAEMLGYFNAAGLAR